MELLRAVTERGAPLRTRVRGFSMAPFIRDGDVVTIAPMPGGAPRAGEVVAFVHPETGRLAIHRVIARVGAGWLVRGDNSPQADGVVRRENIFGVVTRVERSGRGVPVGLGAEARLIAWLQRAQMLQRALGLVRRLLATARKPTQPCSTPSKSDSSSTETSCQTSASLPRSTRKKQGP
jgi:hypothetical protein